MQYLCLVYEDEQQLDQLTDRERGVLRDEDCAHVHELHGREQLVAISEVDDAVRVRMRDGAALIADDEPFDDIARLGRCVVIEARDLNEAIRLAARTPMARFGYVEIRPLQEPGGVL